MAWKFWDRNPKRRRVLTNADLAALVSLLDRDDLPNLNPLACAVRNIDPLALNIKQLGYRLARDLAAALPPRTATMPQMIGLASKLSIQADMESDWVAHWCAELKVPVVFHRKLWELSYVLQALYEGGFIAEGMRGLGFGCGEETIASYLAAHGVTVVATDLPPEASEARGWVDTRQHAAHLDQAFHAHLVDRATFDRHVSLRYVDMNALPYDLSGFDFCWSICALEHVGSIELGLDFIEQSLRTLRPGGISVHTSEFNIDAAGPTIDHWQTVLFQRGHIEALANRLAARGHCVAPLDFSLGTGALDGFVDLPPWGHDLTPELNGWLGEPAHLKLAIDGFVSTCFGIIVTKGG